ASRTRWRSRRPRPCGPSCGSSGTPRPRSRRPYRSSTRTGRCSLRWCTWAYPFARGATAAGDISPAAPGMTGGLRPLSGRGAAATDRGLASHLLGALSLEPVHQLGDALAGAGGSDEDVERGVQKARLLLEAVHVEVLV